MAAWYAHTPTFQKKDEEESLGFLKFLEVVFIFVDGGPQV